ncbi:MULTISPECIES: EAL domain-containing protein [unclassified Cryobacterium]|uniref:EAL domain-containing protein n=1 Tax=unclassified Cryobacterium TaxID=2649013 RepID=UPI0018CAFBA4|nr:EAL domain-containing protein [Cryobacterium sp. CAN_C3]
MRDLERSDHDRAIVDGILRLADSLNLDVVAEGIETTGQRDLLSEMGCRYGQGYLFSKPAQSAVPRVTLTHRHAAGRALTRRPLEVPVGPVQWPRSVGPTRSGLICATRTNCQ